ncbi:LegC family aminotransferase [Pseudomonadales bacterium]|nr:LegC family aminotransferase [Pseudomonadales bacterium]
MTNIVNFVRELYQTKEFIPLHSPVFKGNELKYVTDTINSTFVSSVGKYVDDFERKIEDFTGASKAVATVNGTAALHTALYLAGVKSGDMVITQALTFVATCNVIYHMGAEPVFVDVSPQTLSLSPQAVEHFLLENASIDEAGCHIKSTKQPIRAVVPMHTFGHPAELDELQLLCSKWGLVLVEDAAESLGSYYKGRHTGTIGDYAALSFNGNKIITTGGGGMVLCSTEDSGIRAKHVTTTAKVPHAYEFYHDEPGFNFRLPNLNAALGCGQIEVLPQLLADKRKLAMRYKDFFKQSEYTFVDEPVNSLSNFWLNAVICPDRETRDELIKTTNESGVMTRPVWQLMHRLPMFCNAARGDLQVSEWIEGHLVNLPSSPVSF